MKFTSPQPTDGEDPRQFLVRYLQQCFPKPHHGLITETSEEFLASDDPRVEDVRRLGIVVPWVATSFAPVSPQFIHVGFVLPDADHVQVGLHVVSRHAALYQDALNSFSAATGYPIVESKLIGELKCDAPPILLDRSGLADAASQAALFCAWLSMAIKGESPQPI